MHTLPLPKHIPACADCKYAEYDMMGVDDCLHPEAQFTVVDNVRGHIEVYHYGCHTCRSVGQFCGPSAQAFEKSNQSRRWRHFKGFWKSFWNGMV